MMGCVNDYGWVQKEFIQNCGRRILENGNFED
jgi:hypothetical protein